MAHHARQSRIFIVRLWTENRDADILYLRGMVRNVQSGETRYFRHWQDFVAFLDKERLSAPLPEFETDKGERQEFETQKPVNQEPTVQNQPDIHSDTPEQGENNNEA